MSSSTHDRKVAEKDLRRSEAFLAEAQRLSHTGTSGSVKHVPLVAHAVRQESGNTEFIGAVMDVTAEKSSQQATLCGPPLRSWGALSRAVTPCYPALPEARRSGGGGVTRSDGE